MGNQGRSNDYGTTAMRGDRSTNPTNANAGPHDSKMANKMDPRVDSDMGKRSQPPKPQGQADGIDNRATDTNVGPHGSKLANKMDPRVDSDMGKSNQPVEPNT